MRVDDLVAYLEVAHIHDVLFEDLFNGGLI
jgi:hypothetical protein